MPRIVTSWYYKLMRLNRRKLFLVFGLLSVATFLTLTNLHDSLDKKSVRISRHLEFTQNKNDIIQSEWRKRDTKSVQDTLNAIDQKFINKQDSLVPGNEKEIRSGVIENSENNSKNYHQRDKYSQLKAFLKSLRAEDGRRWREKTEIKQNNLPGNQQSNIQHRHIADTNRSVISELSELVRSISRDKEGRQTIKKMFNGLFGDKPNAMETDFKVNIPKGKIADAIPYNSFDYPLNLDMKNVLQEYREKGSISKYRPINEFPYESIFNPKYICKTSNYGSDQFFLLFIVKSGPGNAERRKTLRQTWANSQRFPNIRTVFSLGLPSDVSIAKRIKRESITYNDILLVNYSDTYNNLTLKTISGINWAVEFCNEAKYVISVDDDMYVATDLVLNHLKNVAAKHSGYYYSGMVHWDSEPVRDAYEEDYNKKWVLTMEEYPYKSFPPYVIGCLVMMSMETVKDLQVIIPFTKFIRIEDAFLGLVASKLGIVPIDNENVDIYKTYTTTEKFKTVIASHFYSEPWELRKAWECHLSIIEHNVEKAIYCEYLTAELKKMRKHLDNILFWAKEAANAL